MHAEQLTKALEDRYGRLNLDPNAPAAFMKLLAKHNPNGEKHWDVINREFGHVLSHLPDCGVSQVNVPHPNGSKKYSSYKNITKSMEYVGGILHGGDDRSDGIIAIILVAACIAILAMLHRSQSASAEPTYSYILVPFIADAFKLRCSESVQSDIEKLKRSAGSETWDKWKKSYITYINNKDMYNVYRTRAYDGFTKHFNSYLDGHIQELLIRGWQTLDPVGQEFTRFAFARHPNGPLPPQPRRGGIGPVLTNILRIGLVILIIAAVVVLIMILTGTFMTEPDKSHYSPA